MFKLVNSRGKISSDRKINFFLIIMIALLIVVIIMSFDNRMHMNKLNKKINENLSQVREEMTQVRDEIFINRGVLNQNLNKVFKEREGLVAFWLFDENSTKDFKGNNDALNRGAIYTPEGKFGGAFEFDGYQSYILLPGDSEDFNLTKGAISFWIYPELSKARQEFGGLLHYRKNDCCTDLIIMRLWQTENGDYITIRSEINNNGTIDLSMKETFIKENEWSHVLIQQTGMGIEIYVNGEKQELEGLNSRDWFSNHFPASFDFTVGHKGSWENNNVPGYFKGKIDEIKIWSRTLTEAEISDMAAIN